MSRLSRRSFITLGAVGAAAGIAAAADASMRRKRNIGLQLYSVRDDCAKDLSGTLKAVAAMGYGGIEFAGYYGRSAAELKQMLAANKLACFGTHIGLDTLEGDNLAKTIAFNRELGNRMLIVPWIPPTMRDTREHVIQAARKFSDIAKSLAPAGMMLGYHNEPDNFTMIDGELQWQIFFDHADRSVAIQFDIGNALEAGVQAAPLIAKFPGRVLSVHVKDHSTTNPKALLGEGDEHWSEVMPLILGKAGTRWFIIEQETYALPPLDCAEKCLRNFERLLVTYDGAR